MLLEKIIVLIFVCNIFFSSGLLGHEIVDLIPNHQPLTVKSSRCLHPDEYDYLNFFVFYIHPNQSKQMTDLL